MLRSFVGSREHLLHLATKRIPKEATHWGTRRMAEYAGVTWWQVRQVWAAADLKPHRLRSFKIINDPQFSGKVVDVVGLYLDPPDQAVVLSVDEKTQTQTRKQTNRTGHWLDCCRLGPMSARTKLLDRILRGTADLNIPFQRLCSLLRSLGFDERTKGSHHIFTMEGIPEILKLQPKGAKAKAYQVRQVRRSS